MKKDPEVLPLVGVIAAPGIAAEDVVRAVNDELLEIVSRTDAEPFDFTDYYRREMGEGLVRFWCVASRLAPAAQLADWKLRSRELEMRWGGPGARRVNLDPGYLTSLQVILATTKPLPQAIYLRDGIYALVELLYRAGGFKSLPWTYPDYGKAASEGAFEMFRSNYLKLLRGEEA
jgi:hypothetical protein